MEKNTGIAIVLSSIIIGRSFIFGTTKISNSMDNAGSSITSLTDSPLHHHYSISIYI